MPARPPPSPQPDPGLAEARIARAIEEDIIFGRATPGELLREEQLLQRFGQTRHIIRRALGRLETLGIVVKERNHSAVVRTFSPQEVIDIHDVREVLQRQAALRIKLPATPAQIAQLTLIAEEYERHLETGDLRGIHLANERFHDALFALCGNRHLQELIGKLLSLTYAVRSRSLADPQDRAKARAEHRMMLGLLAGRDNWALAEICVEHIRSRRDAYLDFLAGRSQDRGRRRRTASPDEAGR